MRQVGNNNEEETLNAKINEDMDISTGMTHQKVQENLELKSRVLALEFWLREEHFVQGRLIVKCVAEISGVYREETASYVISKHKAPHKVLQARSKASTLQEPWNPFGS